MFKPLRHRNYTFLWVSLIASGAGQVLFNVGVMVTVLQETGSALQTVGVNVADTLPRFLLGPFAGAIVDRYPRRLVLMASAFARAGLVAVTIIQVVVGDLDIWLIYLLVFGMATAATFQNPAKMSIVPSLVPKRELVLANSLILATFQATMAGGLALGGVWISLGSFLPLAVADLVCMTFAGIIVLFIDPAAEKAAASIDGPRVNILRSVREGAAYLRRREPARSLVVMELMEHLSHGIWISAMLLIFVVEALGGTPRDWGFMDGVFYVGALLGSFLAARLARPLSRYPGYAIIGNAFALCALTIAYAFSPSVSVALVFSFLMGPAFGLRDVAQDSLLQATVENRVIGRVYALRDTFSWLIFMLSGLFFAWLADQMPIRLIVVIAGIVYGITALFALSRAPIRNGRVIEEEEPDLAPTPTGD